MPSSIMNVVTPVALSPFITAQFIGAAPLYCGRRAACRLNVPRRGISHTTFGSILKATTTKRSAFHAASASRNSGSFSETGCSTGMLCSTAYFLTALSFILRPLPLALSATVTTPTMLCPVFMSSSRGATANSGVPIYTILVFLNVPIIFLFICLNAFFIASMLNTDESFMAFHERKSPVGRSM